MRTKPSQNNPIIHFTIVLLTVMVFSFSMTLKVSAAVNADFQAYAENTSIDAIPPNDIAGIVSMSAVPNGSIQVKELAMAFGLGAPFDGQSLLATVASTMTIDLTLPENHYAFDYATQFGNNGDVFSVKGYRTGDNTPVFTNNYPITSGALNVAQATGTGPVFNRLVISVTAGIWALDNLVTSDNATAGTALVESGGSTDVTEGAATDTYTLMLNTAPTGNVIIDITADAQCTVNPSQITFNTGSFAPQTVTVTAVNDLTPEASPHNCVISHAIRIIGTLDLTYTLVSIPSITAHVTDNDTVGVTITESGGSTDISESGATDTYTIVLESQPPTDVIVTATPDSQCDLGAGAGVAIDKTFTNGNWFTAQTVTVSAFNDSVVEGPHTCTITHSTSGDASYNSAPLHGDPVIANITDNDGTGVTENFNGFTAGQPVENLTIFGISTMSSTPANSTQVFDVNIPAPFAGKGLINTTQGTTTFTFTQPQKSYTFDFATYIGPGSDTFIVQGFRVGIANPIFTDTYPVGPQDLTEASASITGVIFDRIVISATTTQWAIDNLVTTNAVPGIAVFESGGSTDVTEGGATDTYQIALNSPPNATVNINLTPDSQCTVSPNPVVFNASTFAPKTVTVTAVNDTILESNPHNCVIGQSASTTDTDYSALSIPNIVASVTDNDAVSVTIVESGGSTDVTEGGATDSYTIELGLVPTANVTVHITTDGQCSVSPVNLVFATGTTGPLPVTVTAFDDIFAEGSRTCTIDHTVSSADANYDNLTPNGTPVIANVTDNEPADAANASPIPNVFNTHTLVLTWNVVSGATGYEVQVDTDKNFALPNSLDDATIPGSNLSLQVTLPSNIYYWRVRAKDANGKFGGWSTVNSFVVSAP